LYGFDRAFGAAAFLLAGTGMIFLAFSKKVNIANPAAGD